MTGKRSGLTAREREERSEEPSAANRGRVALAGAQWLTARQEFEVAISTEDGPEARDGLGRALWWMGDVKRALTEWELAYVAFARRDDRRNAARIAMTLSSEYAAAYGDVAASKGWEANAERLLIGAEPCSETVLMALRRARRLTDPVEGARLFKEAMEAARALGDHDLEIFALSAHGRALVCAGSLELGFAQLDEAMARTTVGELEDHWLVADTSCNLLIACERAHDLGRATEWCRVAENWARRHHCRPFFAFCRVSYGSVLFARGAWAEAEDELVDAVRRFDETHPAACAGAVGRLAELRLAQGQIAEAAAMLVPWYDHPACTYAAAGLDTARGELDVAANRLERRISAVDPDPSLLAPLCEALAEVHLSRGDRQGAVHCGARLAAIAERHPSRALAAMADATLGAVAAQTHALEAVPRLSRALDAYVELAMPYRAARAQLAMARALGRGQGGAAAAAAALATFERLGAIPCAESAADLLRTLQGTRPAVRRTRGVDALTKREAQVLELVAEGLSNPLIAERLDISAKTAEHHVCSILAKLDLKTRAAAAAWLARRDK